MVKTRRANIKNGKDCFQRAGELTRDTRRADVQDGKDSYERMGEKHSTWGEWLNQ